MKNTLNKFITIIGIVTILASAPTNASTVIDFDDAASNAVLDNVIGTHSTGGLTFTSFGSFMGVWNSSTPNSNGTNSLIFSGFNTGDYMQITRTGGGLFDLLSFDLTISWYDGNPLETIFVNGSPINIIQGMQTFSVGLTGVSQVDITGVPSNTGYWALDNVVVAVPEPETYAMLLAGLGLLGFAVRRKNA